MSSTFPAPGFRMHRKFTFDWRWRRPCTSWRSRIARERERIWKIYGFSSMGRASMTRIRRNRWGIHRRGDIGGKCPFRIMRRLVSPKSIVFHKIWNFIAFSNFLMAQACPVFTECLAPPLSVMRCIHNHSLITCFSVSVFILSQCYIPFSPSLLYLFLSLVATFFSHLQCCFEFLSLISRLHCWSFIHFHTSSSM